jgi:putative ABC transport system permease protein
VGTVVVDDGANLAMLTGGHGDDLARAQAVLRSGGIVVADPLLLHDGRIDLAVQRPDAGPGKDAAFSLPGYALTSGVPGFGAVVGPTGLAGHGLSAERGVLLVSTTRMPTVAEIDAFNEAALDVNPVSWVSYESGPGRPETDLSLIVLALASAIVTLAATAVVTGLAAADGRADLTTLAAVGASPRVRRFMSLSQSGVIAGLGTALGLVAGAAGAYAMIFAINRSMLAQRWPDVEPLPLATPWLLLAGALVVPLIAMLGAGLLTRSRLPIERRAS